MSAKTFGIVMIAIYLVVSLGWAWITVRPYQQQAIAPWWIAGPVAFLPVGFLMAMAWRHILASEAISEDRDRDL